MPLERRERACSHAAGRLFHATTALLWHMAEKRWNPVLSVNDRKEFIEHVVCEIPVRPANMDQIVVAKIAG